MADIISELAGLDDGALSTKIGFTAKLKTIKDNLAKADALTGEPRKKIVKDLERGLAPSTYVFEDLEWQIKHAQQKEKTGCSPADVISCACGD